jgi:hypothetical protein
MVITSLAGTTSIGKFGSTRPKLRSNHIRLPYKQNAHAVLSRLAHSLQLRGGEHGLRPWHQPQLDRGGFDQAIPEKLPVERLAHVDTNVLVRPTRLEPLCLVVAAVWANLVRLLHFVAIRAFSQRRLLQENRAPAACLCVFSNAVVLD